MFNRPGPRLVTALEWLSAMFGPNPDLDALPEFPYEWLEAQVRLSFLLMNSSRVSF